MSGRWSSRIKATPASVPTQPMLLAAILAPYCIACPRSNKHYRPAPPRPRSPPLPRAHYPPPSPSPRRAPSCQPHPRFRSRPPRGTLHPDARTHAHARRRRRRGGRAREPRAHPRAHAISDRAVSLPPPRPRARHRRARVRARCRRVRSSTQHASPPARVVGHADPDPASAVRRGGRAWAAGGCTDRRTDTVAGGISGSK